MHSFTVIDRYWGSEEVRPAEERAIRDAGDIGSTTNLSTSSRQRLRSLEPHPGEHEGLPRWAECPVNGPHFDDTASALDQPSTAVDRIRLPGIHFLVEHRWTIRSRRCSIYGLEVV